VKKLILILCLGISVSAIAQIDKWNTPYSGFGKMSLGMALNTILPPGLDYKLQGVDEALIVSWNVQSGTVRDAMNDIANKNQMLWTISGRNVIISKQSGNQAIIPPVATSTTFKPIPTSVVAEKSLSKSESIVRTEPNVKTSEIRRTEVIETITPGPTDPKPSHKTTSPTNLPIATIGKVDPKSEPYTIRADDSSLSLALRRWTADAGYQLAWEAPKDFPARETTYNTTNILDAIEGVMKDTSPSNYPLHACVYENKVIRVLPISQSCNRIAGSGGAR
jgi:hypothetical protein